jgi:putative membrane protein
MQQQQQQQDANGMNGPAAGASAGPSMDKAFVKKALEGSMAEVQMGQLALQKSSDDQVKQFAQRMVDDHGKMVDQMKPVAEQMGVKVPDSPSKGQMKSMEKMKALSGDDFDKAYIKDMVKDHKKDSSEFKQEAQSTQNPQLKELVTQGSQTIDSHLQQIQQIAQSKGTEKAKM